MSERHQERWQYVGALHGEVPDKNGFGSEMNSGHYTQSPIWLSQHEGIASPSSTAVNEDSVEESDEEEDDGDDDLDGYEDEEDEDSDADEAESMSGDEPTVPHWQIWGALLDWADPVAPATGYVQEPAEGKYVDDRTAFLLSQKTWANESNYRPSILKRWQGPRDELTYKLGVLKFGGRVVVDWEGNAIRGFKNIPVCISSNVEGWRIESWMRADARLRMSDLVARIRARATPGGRVPVYTHTTLTKRSQLFRQKSALITWGPTHPKPTTKANMDFVNAIRRAEMTPAQFASNLALPRDLTDDEHAQLLHLTKKPGSVSRTANAAATKAARSAAQSSNTKTTRSKRTATTATATPPASRAANVDSSQKGRRVTTRSITKAAGGAADVRSSQWQHMVPATSAFQSSNYAAKTGRRQANHVLPATPFIISVRNAAYADSSQGHRGVTAITSARSSDLFPNTHNNRGNPDLSFLGDPFISYAEFVADYYEGRIPDQYL